MSEYADILRIIASEGGRLDANDRAAIIKAAEELEDALHKNERMCADIIEANARLIAMGERLKEMRKQGQAKHQPLIPVDDHEPSWSYGTGLIKVIMS